MISVISYTVSKYMSLISNKKISIVALLDEHVVMTKLYKAIVLDFVIGLKLRLSTMIFTKQDSIQHMLINLKEIMWCTLNQHIYI